MTTSIPGYRTPPTVKWLLNERAALRGQEEVARKRAAALERKLTRLEQEVTVARELFAATLRQADTLGQTAQSLEVALDLLARGINPEAAGVVVPWAGKYGQRGALTAFLQGQLQAASPKPIEGAALTRAAEVHFKLELLTAADRNSFRNSVKNRLWALHRSKDVIEPVHLPTTGANSSLWRWKQKSPLSELQALARESGHDPPADATGGEVDRQ